ncbi:RidA family protein [Variovorax terrae]|uniref:RidA family protein n=1 Tax=Variovorax terrae TaxID=2923278 RepID=A0A9X1W055_9BURK|nr:RidA family protein [Variovorax terrae]MCJ0766140.1 RidA family protein [Variovorax terrae]
MPHSLRSVCSLLSGLVLATTAGALYAQETGSVESRLKSELTVLGFANGELPVLKPAFGNYVDAVQVDNLLILSSAAPQRPDGQFVKGRVPDQVSVNDAMVAAKLACVRQIARMKLALGDLNRVQRIAYVKGKIWSTPEFTDQTKITDACSSLFVAVFGDAGKHARTTEGIASGPFGATFEVETFVEVKPSVTSMEKK